MTTMESSFVSAILTLVFSTGVPLTSKYIEEVKGKVQEVSPAFGDFENAEVGDLLSRAIGDPELEKMAREVDTVEEFEEFKKEVLNKYHYVTAEARGARALELMRKY